MQGPRLTVRWDHALIDSFLGNDGAATLRFLEFLSNVPLLSPGALVHCSPGGEVIVVHTSQKVQYSDGDQPLHYTTTWHSPARQHLGISFFFSLAHTVRVDDPLAIADRGWSFRETLHCKLLHTSRLLSGVQSSEGERLQIKGICRRR